MLMDAEIRAASDYKILLSKLAEAISFFKGWMSTILLERPGF